MSIFPKKFAAIVGFHTLYNTIHEEGIMYPRYILSNFKNGKENLKNGINHNTIIFLTADNLDKDKLVGARNYKINSGDRFIITHKDVFSLFDGRAIAGPTGEQGQTGATGPQGKDGVGIFPLTFEQKEFLVERFSTLIDKEDNNNDDYLNSILTRYIINQEFSIEVIGAIKQYLQEFKSEYPHINGSIIIGTYLYICDTDLLITDGILNFNQYFDMKGETGEQGPQGKDGLSIYPLTISLVESLLTLLRNNGLYFEDLETSFSTLNKILNDFVDKNISNSDYVIVLSTLQDFKQQYSINDSIIVEDYLYQVNVEALKNGTWTFSSYLLLKGEGGVMGETGKDGIGIFPLTREQKSYLNMRFADDGVYREIPVEDIDPFDENILNDNLNTVLTHYIDYLMNTGSNLGDLIYDILMSFKNLYSYINGSIIIGDYLYLVNIDALKNGGGWLLSSYDNLKGNTGANGADGKEGLGLFPLTYFQEEKMVELFNKNNVFSLALEDLGYPLNGSIKNDENINNVLTNYLDGKLTKAQYAVDISLGEFKSLYPYINGSIIVGDYLYLVNIDALYGGGGWILAGYEKLKGEQGPTGPSGSIGIQGEQGPTGPTGPIGKGIYVLDDNQKSELYDLIFNVYDYGLKDDTLIDALIKTVKTFNGEDLISPSNVEAVLSALDDFISKNDINGSIIIYNYLFYIDSEGTPRDYTDLKGEKGEKGEKGTGPIGSVMLWAGNDDVEIPEGWLECGRTILASERTITIEDGVIPTTYIFDCYVIKEGGNEAILYNADNPDFSSLLKVIGTKYGAGNIQAGYAEIGLPNIEGISTTDGKMLKYIICYK